MTSARPGAAVVLERLLASACALTGARYAVLAPLTPPDPDAVLQGPVSHGDGAAPGSVLAGPDVLERPVTAGGRAVARLQLTGAVLGSAEDDLVDALAAVAGMVLESARSHRRSEQRLVWLEASARLTQVFAPPLDLAVAFGETVRMARSLAGAAGVALVRRKEDVVQPLAVDGQRWSTFEPLLARTRWYAAEGLGVPELVRPEARASDLLVVAPMHSEVKGAAALVATFEASPDAEVVGLLCAFAGQAAFAFDRAQAVESGGQLRELSGREGVARDLHDHVLQRLFGIGLQVQVVREATTESDVRARLDEVSADLEQTVAAIRSTIFTLRGSDATESEPDGSQEP